MGQSGRIPRVHQSAANDGPCLSVFPTNLGWCGIVGRKGVTTDILIGHSDAQGVRQAFARRRGEARGGAADEVEERDWHSELRRRLEAYGLGKRVDFTDFEIELPGGTPFRQRVLKVTRKIGYGRTLSYGELAERAGAPRAARAVGTVMSTNRFPILIPCHRVIASAGKLGGYSAPQGVDLKARLLAMEAETMSADR